MGCGASQQSEVITNKPVSNYYGPPPPYQSPYPHRPHQEAQQVQHVPVIHSSSTQSENNEQEFHNVEKQIILFVEYQSIINELEKKNVEEMFLVHTMEYETVKVALEKKQAEYDLLYSQMLQETNGGEVIHHTFTTMSFVNAMSNIGSTQQQEVLQYLETKNKVDICKKQLDCLLKQQQELQSILETENRETKKLKDFRDKLDSLLESMFDGEYGSELEESLELHVEQLFLYKQHLSITYSKWQNAHQLIYNACCQMSYAYRRWMQIDQIPENNNQAKYYLATETRNHMIAADQNCRKAAEFIMIKSMPYWNLEDFKNIVININSIYNDVITKTNFNRALAWFKYYHYRLSLQLQWIDSVISTKLAADYQQTIQNYKQKYLELRLERIRCLQEVAKKWSLNIDFRPIERKTDENQEGSISLQISAPHMMAGEEESLIFVPDIDFFEGDPTDFNSLINDSVSDYCIEGNEGILDNSVVKDGNLINPPETYSEQVFTNTEDNTQDSEKSKVIEVEITSTHPIDGQDEPNCLELDGVLEVKINEPLVKDTINSAVKDMVDASSDIEFITHGPPVLKFIPLSELAPAPTDIELFGNIQELQKKHEQEVEEFEKAQAHSKAKQHEDFQQRLKRRKTQRRKLLLQRKEENELLSGK